MKRIRRKPANPSKGKIKNATPCEADGIPFKSKLELYCYIKLKENNIIAEYEGETFTILDAFEYNGEKVRKMTYTPDFVNDNFIIECKGFANESFPLRWKFFKHYLFRNKKHVTLYLLKNKKQIDEAVELISKKWK